MRRLKLFLNVTVTGTMLLTLSMLEAQTQAARPSGGAFQIERSGGSLQYPAGWTEWRYSNMHEIWNVAPDKLSSLTPDERDDMAKVETSVTPVADHAEALQRLREIEAESGMTSTYLVIGGWPALERRQIIRKPTEGDDVDGDSEKLVMVTTAVAAGATVVRMDGFAPSTASPAVIDQLVNICHSWVPVTAGDPGNAARDVQQLRSGPSLRMPRGSAPGVSSAATAIVAPRKDGVPSVKPTPGTPFNLGVFDLKEGSESEIAVSSNGTNVVVAQQCSYRYSTDGGQTFSLVGGYPGSPGHCTGGDSSLAVGQSGNFYWDTIGSNNATCPAPTPPATVNNCNNTQEISRSVNGGQSFSFAANIVDCQTAPVCGFSPSPGIPDQEHIAADRVNPGVSGDQVYNVYRRASGFMISCSTDGASTWTTPAFYNNGGTDFPRITVAQNGTVYVITINGNNVELWSFSSCKSGLTPGLNHVTVASGINQVTCPVSGLDRCNDGNVLSSPTVAVDDTNANHLYASYAASTSAPPTNASFPGNEDVYVRESTDGGNHWSSAVQLNGGTAGTGGRRFQPWICVTEGTAYASWFDRRNSTSTSNDLTDYFANSAFDSGGSLTGGAEFRVDTNADPECASGWPCQSRSPFDSESCSAQPQFGGACRHTPNNSMDSFQACNFASPTCTDPTETCQTGGGCPKYADYTANACGNGRLYNAWPSATDQTGAVTAAGNIVSFFVETVVGSTSTTTSYTGPTTEPYLDGVTLSATLDLGGTSVPVVGQTITFTLGSQGCTGTTNSSGVASCSIASLTQVPGSYTVTASFAGMGNYQASSNSASFTITGAPTTTTYTGVITQEYHDIAVLSATLVTTVNSGPLSGQTITFTLGSQSCMGTTNGSGMASCGITLLQIPGAYTVVASYAGSALYLPSNNSSGFTITKGITTTTYSGPTLIVDGTPTTFSALLKEDGVTPIAGETIQITLGTGGTAQTCTTTATDVTGSGSCTITPNQLYPTTIVANFPGDAFYLPSSNSASVVLNVTSMVTVSVPPLPPYRGSRDPSQCTVVTVDNPNQPANRTTRSTTIAGPVEVLVTNLSSNATLESPAGTFTGSPFTGSPYEIFQPAGDFPPGGEITVGICFLNSTGGAITFTPIIVSGAI